MEYYKLFQIILNIFLLQYLLFIRGISGSCSVKGNLYEINAVWTEGCKNCTCVNSIPICEQIQCKYEPCEKGQIYLLANEECCPKCDFPKQVCTYEGFLIDHNTEFSPKLCETCKCRDGVIECVNICASSDSQKFNINKIKEKETCLYTGKCKAIEKTCVYDGQVYQNNSVWSPTKCSFCKCENEIVNCYVAQCPNIECQNGFEMRPGECCPVCKPLKCIDEKRIYFDGDSWTREKDHCTHCSCQNGRVSCFTESCAHVKCAKDEVFVSKPNKCCPQCVSKLTENCEYFGKTYYSGEMWYKSGCQHCSCDYGKVSCTNIECESKFCMKDEIMVKRKDDCCVECRKPIVCEIDQLKLKIKENDFWNPEPCKLCQCLMGESKCYTNNCIDSTNSQSVFEIQFSNSKEISLNANNLNVFLKIKDFLKKDSMIQILSGPQYGSIYLNDKRCFNFTLNDLESSKLIYKYSKLDGSPKSDYIILNTVSPYSGFVYTILIKIRIDNFKSSSENFSFEHDTVVMHDEDVALKSTYKTIHVIPGEAIKLTPNELKPKNINPNIIDRLIYNVVSGKPKFGEIKLKKLFGSDEVIPPDWNQVNDIYLEKVVKEFSHIDLENGNVWYESFNEYESQDDECYLTKNNDNDYQNDINCISGDCNLLKCSSKGLSSSHNSKYDHLLFEVYDKEKTSQILSKEIIHFNIQSQIINETTLGLEVIENQVTPFTFSNFDIAGIDSNRQYLVYKIIKPLEKNQGQLEHSTKPGVPVEIFTQNDLNRGFVLYHSPREIGIYPKDFAFTFIVTNDNRSDTFPETPFHIRVLPSNDQAPTFKEGNSNIKIVQGAGITLPKELFEVEDPDTSIDNIIFTIEKPPDNLILELNSKGHQYSLHKDESFTMQEIRNGSFRLIHNGVNIDKDSFKISVSDGKHVTIKTFYISIQLFDRTAPRTSSNSSMVFNVKEGQTKTLRRENLAFYDDKSSAEDIVFILKEINKLIGKIYLRNKQLKTNMKFTQADVDLQNIKYEAPHEIGPITVTDFLKFDVSDKEGNVLKDQVLSINLEPNDNQKPIVEITQPATVEEGGFLVLNENYIRIRDADSAKEQLNVVIDSQPRFGYFENSAKGTKLTSFPLTDLINGHTIRYVQNDHLNKEPNTDSFVFHVTDGVNQSPTYNFIINIELVNDEAPVAIIEPLKAEYSKKVLITNETLLIVDFDTKPEDLTIQIEELSLFGDLYLNDKIVEQNVQFSYSDVINKKLSFKYTSLLSAEDEIKLRITDGKFSTSTAYKIKLAATNLNLPVTEINNGLQGVSGQKVSISKDMLHTKNTNDKNIFYHLTHLPSFGKIQYKTEETLQIITFSQRDIDEGKVVYNHESEDPSGVTYLTYNVSDVNGNILTDQRFAITVRDDKLPPAVIINKGLKVNQGKNAFLTRLELDVKDDDTANNNLYFTLLTSPKNGLLENIKEPGKMLKTFTYDDLSLTNIRYTHNNLRNLTGDDFIDIRVSDGKNEASVTLNVIIIRNDNMMPQLVSPFILHVKELGKKLLTKLDLNIIDPDTPSNELKFIITHPPQYGVLERFEKNIKLKNQTSLNQMYASTESEFSLKDIELGLIYYTHKTSGALLDRFGFVIFDGVNNMFLVNGMQVSTTQVFNIYVDSEINQPPYIERSIGIEYLYHINGVPGRMITTNELNVVDKDDQNKDLIINIVRQPAYGIIEHKDRVGIAVSYFTQEEVNQNKLYFILNKKDERVTQDYFLFDVQDSAKNIVRNNRFDIKWSVLNFEVSEITVMENEGKARVHIVRSGNLKQYSMVTCRTVSDTAKSNRDSKNFDFIHTVINMEFNEGESYKACDIVIQKDSLIESIESFYVTIEDPKYSVIGSIKRVKINILDKQKVAIIEFDRIKYEIQESDKLISIPITRTGDLNSEIQVNCYTEDDTARSNQDYIQRKSNSLNVIKIPAGETFGFCDIELIDDDLHEAHSESFQVYLTVPSNNVQIGTKNVAQVSILGPNDLKTDSCKTTQIVVTENAEHVVINIQRKNGDLSQPLEVKCTSFTQISSKVNDSNVQYAVENEDYVPIDEIIRFLPGEQIKKCYVKILNDNLNPIMEGLKVFSVQIKPILDDTNKSNCNIIEPDIVNITIDDFSEDSISICFNETNFIVQELAGNLSIPIIRKGDLSQAFSLICFTRQLTAIEDKDYVGRYTMEQSRITFAPGEKVKNCTIEILDDSIYEADETFQVKLSDLRGLKDAKFDQLMAATVTILNEEDATIISLSDSTYYTERPSSNDSIIIKPITVVRRGDLSRKSIVRISTSDGTAIAGKDYKSKTESVTFEPGVSALDFDIKILYRFEDKEKDFRVYLGPQDPVAASFGKIKSTNVYIKDMNSGTNYIKSQTDSLFINENIERQVSSPYLLSIREFSVNDTIKDFINEDQKISLVSSSYPLICINICNKQHPYFSKFQESCNLIDNSKISYSWEISSSNEFGKYSNFVKLTDNSAFFSVNQSILETFYFRPKFRVRCISQINKSLNQGGSSQFFKSNTVQIIPEKRLSTDKISNEMKCYDRDDKILPETNLFNSLPLVQKNTFFEQSVFARAEYISEESSTEYKNRVKISINIAYRDGVIPLISTSPLHNCRIALTDQQYNKAHICSNFIDKSVVDFNNVIKYGFLNNVFDSGNYSDITNLLSKFRENKTKKLFSNLDLKDCEWKFTAYYDLNELIKVCEGNMIYESETRESGKHFITVKIPLYISYAQANSPSSWNCIEHKTEVDLSLQYVMYAHEKPLIENSIVDDANMASVLVSKIKFDDDGRLIIEISTVSYFNGYFIKSFKNQKSRAISPNGAEYDLDLYSEKVNEQIWRIKSAKVQKDYTGNYTLELIPCISDDKNNPNLDYLIDCDPKKPMIYTLPIFLEQAFRPLPMKYSLDTTFHLSAKHQEFDESSEYFDGYFRKDDKVYATIYWNPKNDLKSSYKLRIEKVYLCSSINGHIPFYDPDGTFYKRGPQFGCSESHKFLIDQYILLDRNSTLETPLKKILSFNPKFLNDKNIIKNKIIKDGFSFDVNPLFDQESNQENSNKNWYLQVFFYIGPTSTMDSFKLQKRDNGLYYSSIYNFSSIYNNGTNIQKLKLTSKERSNINNNYNYNGKIGHRHQLKSSNKDTLLKFIIPIIVIIIVVFLTFIGVLFYKKSKGLNLNLINEFKSPPFPVNTSRSNSTESSMIVVATKSDYSQKDCGVETKLLKQDPFGEDSNCTIQTVISSSTSSTNSNSNMLGNEAYSTHNSNKANESTGFYGTEKLKSFFKKMYAPVPTESDENSNFTVNRYNNLNTPSKSGSNYLYFNYNNTDLSVNNDSAKISSTKSLVINNTNNTKRFSGTEV